MEFADLNEELMSDGTYNEFLKEIEEFGITNQSPPSTPTNFLDQPFVFWGNQQGTNIQLPQMNVHSDESKNTVTNPSPFLRIPIGDSSQSPSTPLHYVASPSNSTTPSNPSSFPLSTEGIKIIAQPKKYQIVNYNIYPAPEIEFAQQFEHPITIQAFLIYETSIVVDEGFTHGDVQVLKPKENKISFPALHLNRMTPIKNAIQQSGSSLGSNFYIRWNIGDLTFTSTPFKLVSACNQIPEEENVRPRQKSKKEAPKPIKHGGKRRATEEVMIDDDLFLHVKVRGDATHRGFINLPFQASLSMAREEISKSAYYPKSFRFWHEPLGSVVQFHQESSIKAEDAADGTCLIIDHYDMTMENIDDQFLALWLSKKDVKEPLVELSEIVRTLFSVYNPNTTNLQELDIINGGISHFFMNITKHNQPGMVGIEDFKLFLKFFGPATDCLTRLLNVYREPFFHGFARHSDAVDLLKGNPGAFLVRYSESQLKDGFFAFTVNKGNGYKDVIENYSLKYHSDIGCFVFRNRQYRTLQEFVSDKDYGAILRRPLTKTTVETIKESKYCSDTDFLGQQYN